MRSHITHDKIYYCEIYYYVYIVIGELNLSDNVDEEAIPTSHCIIHK